MSLFILPHNSASEGARDLSRSLGIKRIKREKSKYVHKDENVIINWGCNDRPPHIPEDAAVLNPFDNVAIAANKLSAFKILRRHVPIPDCTEDIEVARRWRIEDGATVVVRTILNGHAGKGIQIFEPNDPQQLPNAPLYVKYVPKKSEYRVHVFNGQVIDVTRKTLRDDMRDKQNINWKIRNLDNGFIFSRFSKENVLPDGSFAEEKDICPRMVLRVSQAAVKCLGLTFGAVDVIWNKAQNRAYVLEVNTAPGLADTVCERYRRAIREYMTGINDEVVDNVEDIPVDPIPFRPGWAEEFLQQALIRHPR